MNDFDSMLIDLLKDDYKQNTAVPLLYKRHLFTVKDNLLMQKGTKVCLEELVRDVFPGLQDASLGAGEADGKGCVLFTTRQFYNDKNGERRYRENRMLLKDDYDVDAIARRLDTTSLLFPFTVFGKRHKKENAHELHAMVIDIDYVWEWHLKNLLHQFETGRCLMPSYITNSGNGIHAWYVFTEPINFTLRQGQELLKLKKMLMYFLWNDATSADADRDTANIYQGFRVPGTYTKLAFDETGKLLGDAEKYRTSCYRMTNAKKYTIRDLYAMFPPGWETFYENEHPDNKLPNLEIIEAKYPWENEKTRTCSLKEAKELYPEWYEDKILGKKRRKKEYKGWICHEGLYNWWIEKMRYEAKVGGRYWAIRALAQYGVKCGIDRQKIKDDAYAMLAYFDSLSVSDSPADRFTQYDIDCALAALDDDDITRKKQSTRAFISGSTRIAIFPAKRNGRSQQVHLHGKIWENDKNKPTVNVCKQNRELALAYMRENGLIKGKQTEESQVQEWRQLHPDGTKAACIQDTGLSKPTVYKWWGDDEKKTRCTRARDCKWWWGNVISAEQQVREWRQLHPDGKKAACIRDTGLSKPTVYKWWGNK